MENNQILKLRGLKVTKVRLLVLETFNDKAYALSHQQIEEALSEIIDRVTLYRTLKSFEEKGIIHKVLDEGNSVKYALCAHNDCTEDKHMDEHVHFHCEICDKTRCLDNISIPKFKIPDGFIMHQSALLVQGICKECAERKN